MINSPILGDMMEKETTHQMSALGFEPRTNGLKGHCSAVELRTRSFIKSEAHSITAWGVRQRQLPKRAAIKGHGKDLTRL